MDGERRKSRAWQALILRSSKANIVALIGPSGSGKTTLLLSLGGLIRPTTGKVIIDEKSIYELKTLRANRTAQE